MGSGLLHKEAMEEEYARSTGENLPLELAIAHICSSPATSASYGRQIWREGDGNFYMRCGARLRDSCSHDCAASPQGISESCRMMGVLCLQGRVNPFLFFSFFHTLHLVCVYIYILKTEKITQIRSFTLTNILLSENKKEQKQTTYFFFLVQNKKNPTYETK